MVVVLAAVSSTSAYGWLAAGLWLGLVCVGVPAAAQDPASDPSAPPVVTVDPTSLSRIREALQTESKLAPSADFLRFYDEVTVTKPTFADYLQGSGPWFAITTTGPPSSNRSGSRPLPGGGIDLGALFGRWEKALDARKVRQIQEQIDRELESIEATKTGVDPVPRGP